MKTPPNPNRPAGASAPIRVLCVDDNPHDRALIRHALEKEAEGFSLIEAANRAAFEQALARQEFDVVVTDFNILGFEGLEVLEAVRRHRPDIPVILVTGTGSEEVAVEALKSGADDYVIKTSRHIAHLPSTIQKVLESRRVKQQLAEHEANLAAILHNVSDGLLVVDAEGRILFANPAAAAMLGESPEKLVGCSWGYPVSPSQASDEVQASEIELPRRRGGPGYAEMRCAPTRWGGRPAAVVALRDITERREAESALRQPQQALELRNRLAEVFLLRPGDAVYEGLLQLILEDMQSPLGIFGYIDEEGRWVCPTLTGEVWEQCRMADKTAIFPPERWGGLWGQAMREKRSLMANGPFSTPDGHLTIHCALDVPVVFRGELLGNILVANKEGGYDESDMARLESIAAYLAPILHARLQTERERRAKDRIEEQFRHAQKLESIGRLAGGVAHDFNNMINVILGYADLILKQLRPNDPLRDHVTEIVKAGQRSAQLTRQLLAFGRKQPLQPRVVELNELLRHLEEMLQRLIGEHILLKMSLGPDAGRIMVDPGQLEHVIVNLAVNARDAMPQGGTLTIATSAAELDEAWCAHHPDTRPGRYALITVTDTGCGMSREVQERLFEPFFTTKPAGKGSGLGLATAYGIIKQSGGHIWVYSEPGRGTTFKIYLPRAEAPLPAAEPAAGAAATDQSGGAHILVVEDEESLRKLMSNILSRLGYRVTVAANAGEALLLVEEEGVVPDLVITDVIMPKMNGAELVERLKRRHPNLKVLFMSGYPDDAIVQDGLLAPDTPFISKPFSIRDLGEKLRTILAGGSS